jgi:hypothetical protein
MAPATSGAQDWNPVQHGRKYNYKADTAQFIQFGVWIDSARWNGTDSVYYLNRIVTDCDTCVIPGSKLYNQGTFLQRKMQVRADSSYWFHDPGSIVLRPQDSLGATWLFDTANNITALIVDAYADSIWGIADSFKVIALSTTDTIVIGRTLGVIQFHTSDSTINYILTGIDLGPVDWGETVIDIWDIYKFEVGDVIQFSDGWFDGSQPPGIFSISTVIKYRILDREIATAGFVYDVIRWYSAHYLWHNGPPPGSGWIKCIDTMTVRFLQADYDNINAYPNELHDHAYLYQTACSGLGTTFLYKLGVTGSGRRYKEFYWAEDSSTVAYVKQSTTNVLLPIRSDTCSWGVDHTQMRSSFGERLGSIAEWAYYFEYAKWLQLDGYIQDGDTVGELRPDSYFVGTCNVGISTPQELGINIHPNPTGGHILISAQEPLDFNRISLIDVHGRTLLTSAAASQLRLDLSALPSGLYMLIGVSDQGQFLWAEKMIKQ